MRYVRARRNLDAACGYGLRDRVILNQTPPDIARAHPHHGVAIGLVCGIAAKDLNADHALFQHVVLAIESAVHNKLQELFASGTAVEGGTLQSWPDLSLFALSAICRTGPRIRWRENRLFEVVASS
jgi:hypothetical protein